MKQAMRVYKTLIDNDPLLLTAAKAVAEQRQHGCHYAEGACHECVGIAEAALRAVITEKLSVFALDGMAQAAYDSAFSYRSVWDWSNAGAKITARNQVLAAYRGMPVWRVLWAR
jgi:hypothetical protein